MTDPSPVVGGHGPHDDQPPWTVDPSVWHLHGGFNGRVLVRYESIEAGLEAEIECRGDIGAPEVLAWLRDAAEVPALRTHATTLRQAQQKIEAVLAADDGGRFMERAERAALRWALDLLTGETDV